MNLDFAKVCGRHSAIYEAYYKQIDPKGSGAIEAMTAAKFLKKSGLSDVVLSRIWDLSDPNGKGFLDKPGFFVALKLVSVAQSGQVVNMSNIYTETVNPPKVGDLPKIMPPRIQTVPVSSGGVANGDWSISVIDRLKYEQLFESLKPVGGMLPGVKVKGVLMDSKLPMDTLGKIWDLADQDKDGNLDKHEFIVAMHLVYQTLEKRTVPDVLPVELRKPGAGGGVPPPKPAPPVVAMPRAPSGEGFGDGGFVANFPKDIAPAPVPVIPSLPAVPPMTRVPPVGSASVAPPLISTADPLIPIGAPPSVTANADWVVTAAEMKRFEVIFRDSDRDKDGLVSGLEVKNVFLQSGVPQNCLAHIWALCDTNQSGKLTLEQFALAMWMVERKQNGIEPPQVLTANMVPPSMRATVSGIDMQAQEPKPTYSNPELEMISKEIEELAKERRSLETEIAQKEADIRIKSGEVRCLQSELDTLSATLKQLENQRGEAQKRLDDLKAQVNKIREQSQKQEETINEQEGELNAKRSELQKLKDEETALQKEYDENNRELQKLTQHLQNTQLQISSVRSMVTQLMETQRQMTDALIMCRAAIENQDGELVTEYQLKIEPDFDEPRKILEKKIDEPKADPFDDSKSAMKTNNSNGFATNGFGNDPFGAESVSTTNTAVARGGFDDSFNASSAFDSGFDAFGSGGVSGGGGFGQQKDPFGADAFGSNKPNETVKDDFGSDPFAALHAPTGQGQVLSPNAQKSGPPPRPESPSPALPPKKSKVPPPRPAPPRPVQGPARPAQPAMDAFGSSTGGSGFADFADFDNKLTLTSTPAVSAAPQGANFSMLFDTKSSGTTITTSNITTTTTNDTVIGKATPTPYTFAETSNSGKLPSTSASSASPSSSSFASLNNLTNSTINNHLTRSITPLQQAAANAFNPAAPTEIAANKSAAVRGPTDFSDDPFKDYRYEDPFNIKDPFADDDDDDDEDEFKDPEKIFQDPTIEQGFGDDKAKTSSKTSTNFKDLKSSNSESSNSVKANTPLSHDFMEQFDAFNTNASPVPSHKSSNSMGLSAFKDIATSSQRNTPVPAVTIASADAFADFDAFALKATTDTTSIPAARVDSPFGGLTAAPSKTLDDIQNANTEPKANDSFYDAFTDKFNSNLIKDNNSTTTTTTTKTTTKSIFDAFGDTKTNIDPFLSTTTAASTSTNAFGDAFATTVKPTSNLFDDFNDNAFEDDFFRTQQMTTAHADDTANNKNDNNMDFAKFDAFGDFKADFSTALNNSINATHNKESMDGGVTAMPSLVKLQNRTTLTKKQNLSSNSDSVVKLPEKFATDYSKVETFDDDMQEAIRRSMIDQ